MRKEYIYRKWKGHSEEIKEYEVLQTFEYTAIDDYGKPEKEKTKQYLVLGYWGYLFYKDSDLVSKEVFKKYQAMRKKKNEAKIINEEIKELELEYNRNTK